ncbi:MAG: Type secretion system domain protein [Firmicutes bacterium]|nr:Type secretion system domain protein [Bacillota bacterium]
MVLLLAMVAGATAFIISYLVLMAMTSKRAVVAMRLKAIDDKEKLRTDIEEALAKPFGQRIILPLTGRIGLVLARLTPLSIRRLAEEKLASAGGFGGLNTDGFLAISVFLALGLPVITWILMMAAGAQANRVVGFSLIAFSLGVSIPYLLLQRKINLRKASIQKDLPDVLDLLTVSVEAGLGFDGALAKVSEKMKGALVEEFGRALQEIRIGIPRRDALGALGARSDVPDLALFTASLVQADQLGVSIGNVLRVQSVSMREKRRQRAQEKAMKAPVKMLVPLVMFIFPPIFIVLLAPAVIRIITTLGER